MVRRIARHGAAGNGLVEDGGGGEGSGEIAETAICPDPGCLTMFRFGTLDGRRRER